MIADFLPVKLVNNMIIKLLTCCEQPVSHDPKLHRAFISITLATLTILLGMYYGLIPGDSCSKIVSGRTALGSGGYTIYSTCAVDTAI